MKVNLIFFVCLISFYACKTHKLGEVKQVKKEKTTKPIEEVKEVEKYERPIYHATETRLNDLIHTKLEVSFDWQKQHLHGKANLTFKPYFYPTNSLVLDAKGFDIHKIELANRTKLNYTYDSLLLNIQLDKVYNRTDKYEVYIEYTAKPEELKEGGSKAITSDKGLYFINPLNTEPNKPQQIWTQGETEASSCWFPTIDAPNEKTTQEIYITVLDKYITLSNGVKVSSTRNSDGTRTDYWKQDLPHAPYLFMMGIGEFEIIEDSWNNKEGKTIPVNYYVEKEYAPYAKNIFGNTPKMMTFFSDLLGVEYPWDKYHQIVVRDFVSGAMENTTAVIHGDFLYQTDRELLDSDNEFIIAHELFHHWFGNLVTCESWSNLTLNESFANYSQYLWDEYQYGRKDADHNAYFEQWGYKRSLYSGHHDLVWYDYDKREDMFDAHSYNKGGRIVHMLRKYVGDEAFFASLKHYLNKMKYKTAEVADLRLSFEEITGEDLNWFFNQWFFDDGHPKLHFSKEYDNESQVLSITIEQKQDFTKFPVYKLPIDVDIYTSNEKKRERIVVTKDIQTFQFKSKKPFLVNIDAENMLLADIEEEKSEEEWIYQLNNAPLYMDKRNALDNLDTSKNIETHKTILATLNREDFSKLKTRGISTLEETHKSFPDETKATLLKLTYDESSLVRSAALDYLGENYKDDEKVYERADELMKDQSFRVLKSAVLVIGMKDTNRALEFAKNLMGQKEFMNKIITAEVYSKYGKVEHNSYFLNQLEDKENKVMPEVTSLYPNYLENREEIAETTIPKIVNIAKTHPNKDNRLYSCIILGNLKRIYERDLKELSADSDKEKTIALKEKIKRIENYMGEIKEVETDPMILQFIN